MKEVRILTEEEIKNVLSDLQKWKLETEDGIPKLVRSLEFEDFIQAFGYLTKIALLSETMNHHAEIKNAYNRVRLSLYTHTEKNITNLDRDFCYAAEKYLSSK
ncbi:4a-hydroxytetrahydrobiopterin dehydratase [Leptospira idonii]|uniref:4a-hydroxytetrahydrobiopterin dehydratase n=1 Tax=Leptospira idonii TaxID=1193500 RepID=A0A4R9M3L1_9LEPT|nr:4a-hydroxytetrahydrobiopterin dehydratase [Leptospira idonii]TGN20702.1 4a-hydroxytetrahydrobiopterin dehydratase [Leptospira idonii]